MASGTRICNVVPDRLDLRDRLYQPPVGFRPEPQLPPGKSLPVLDQSQTQACTGYALATVINQLLHASPELKPVSPLMLYAMARRYDEFPGSTEDSGSSLRGALKGWYKHGACKTSLWRTTRTDLIPPSDADPAKDWRREAAHRPMGAYYRLDTRSITDMQIALNEAKVLYASARVHTGWDHPTGSDPAFGLKRIAYPNAQTSDGHAFAILGYTSEGFVIQNSWGDDWGSHGLALLGYEDWLDNAMDCWVTQLGVVTRQHDDVRNASSLRAVGTHVRLASDERLRNREIDPFMVDMENNGRLSHSGDFMTTIEDLEALMDIHIPAARKQWQLDEHEPIDIAIYAHGGLTDEGSAAETAARWIPALYTRRIFPIFFMWETDWLSTLKNRMEDLWKGQPMPTGSFKDNMQRFWNERLERLFSGPGSLLWSEMKQNAQAISDSADSGAAHLYRIFGQSAGMGRDKVRLHLIGHSAGAIVHCHLAKRMAKDGWQFGTVAFMAPAATSQLFKDTLLPLIKSRKVDHYHQFHLSDRAESQDNTCSALLGYNRSLLYLVSQSFEGQRKAPILGMETYFKDIQTQLGPGTFGVTTAPCPESASTTHGGFDEDGATMNSILDLISHQAQRAPAGTGRKMKGMEIKGGHR
ncbi:MAG TPA: C1 family peptidase [Geothrix sp.]|nr:C1 family peptidase [Geothrix sp.]